MTPTEQDKELRAYIAECFGMDKHEDWYDSYRYSDREKMLNYITADRKRVALEASDREARLLNALAGMYEQYCGKKYGHDFMGAGEEAISILEDYGVHNEAWEWGEKSDENLSRALARIKAQQEDM